MDSDLLTSIALMYDPITRTIRGINKECLVTITPEEIQEVFGMDHASQYHEVIDFHGLENKYQS